MEKSNNKPLASLDEKWDWKFFYVRPICLLPNQPKVISFPKYCDHCYSTAHFVDHIFPLDIISYIIHNKDPRKRIIKL